MGIETKVDQSFLYKLEGRKNQASGALDDQSYKRKN